MNKIEQDIIDKGVSLEHMPAPWLKVLREQMMEHARQGRTSRALEYARGMLLASPEDSESWLRLAMLYRELGQLGMSARCLAQAEAKEPTHRGVRLEQGEIWVAMGEPGRGLEMIRDVFLEGYDSSKKLDDQDMLTLRAGAILECVQRVVDEMARAPIKDS